jgi:hypothetical protein
MKSMEQAAVINLSCCRSLLLKWPSSLNNHLFDKIIGIAMERPASRVKEDQYQVMI